MYILRGFPFFLVQIYRNIKLKEHLLIHSPEASLIVMSVHVLFSYLTGGIN